MGGEGDVLLQAAKEDESNDGDLVRCKYYSVGCIDMVPHEGYETHLQEKKEEHIKLLEATVIDQAGVIDGQREELSRQMKRYACLTPLFSHFEGCKQFLKSLLDVWSPTGEAVELDLYQRLLALIEPTEEEMNSTGVKLWHLVYMAVMMFILFCYAILTALLSRPLAPVQLLPLTIFCVFASFHWWNAKYLSSLANHLAAVYLVGVWMLLNVILLPVF